MKRMTSELAASSPIKVCLAEVLKAARGLAPIKPDTGTPLS